jgi:transcriptional regulator NrdR family protein
MDENCNVETVLPDIKEIVIKGVSYSFYCKRALEHIAQAIKDDLIEQGKRSIITKEMGEYVVWWA